jgi:hypothetical protein
MYVIIFSIDKNYELYQELKNGGGGFKKFHVKLKNPRNSAEQAPLPPLVRACPEDYREGVTQIELQADNSKLKILFYRKYLMSATM